ncbi:MAG: hypothetical protein GXO44_01395 [Deferribacteres bacterium]|nr:hypothetical protein [Deferribacteres bacterium]
MNEKVERLIESVFEFLKRDDLEVSYREEFEDSFKKSLAPSYVARIKTATAPDGKKLVVTITEVYMDDTAVPYKEIVAELAQNWTEPKRVVAFLYTDDTGGAKFSDQKLYGIINNIWDIIG